MRSRAVMLSLSALLGAAMCSFRGVRRLRISYDYSTLRDDFNIELKYTAVTDMRGTLYAFLTWSRRSLV
jgi:hypothetical protein